MSEKNISILEQNYSWFINHQNELSNKYPQGGYIVIWECKPFGVWETRNKALAEGIKTFGNVPFLVRSLKDEDAHQANFSLKAIF